MSVHLTDGLPTMLGKGCLELLRFKPTTLQFLVLCHDHLARITLHRFSFHDLDLKHMADVFSLC